MSTHPKTLFTIHAIMVLLFLTSPMIGAAQPLIPGEVVDISFPGADLPPTLHTMMTGRATVPTMPVRLPDDYDSSKTFPLLLYVPGLDGGVKGNIGNARMIAGSSGWVAASLPLFKKSVDRDEVAGGLLVSLEDYPVISKAYELMLGRLFELVPNIDRERSAVIGFSNGAITLAVLLSSHDEFILTHFRNFCIVDQGMFHLMDLHKKWAKESRYLVLVGDKEDMGRDLKIRQSHLLQDEMRVLGVDLSYKIMKDTGHELGSIQMAIARKWLEEGRAN